MGAHGPLIDAISAVAIPSLNDLDMDTEEASRGAYAVAWAQGRLSLNDHARIIVHGHAMQGRINRLALGLIILDEEWGRSTEGGGALEALENLTGQSMAPTRIAVSCSDSRPEAVARVVTGLAG